MQTVILAGGLGTRLRPLTEHIPKSMTPIGEHPFLYYQISYLKKFGLSDIVLLIGYLGEQIESFFGDGSRLGVSIQYARERELQGTGGAIRDAEKLLASEFLLLYGDVFLPVAYDVFIRSFKAAGTLGMVTAYGGSENTGIINNLSLREDGLVRIYDKTGREGNLSHVESGVSAFKKDILKYIRQNGALSLEMEVFPRLIADYNLAAYVTYERFYDIGAPDRLMAAEKFFKKQKKLV